MKAAITPNAQQMIVSQGLVPKSLSNPQPAPRPIAIAIGNIHPIDDASSSCCMSRRFVSLSPLSSGMRENRGAGGDPVRGLRGLIDQRRGQDSQKHVAGVADG